MSKLSNEFETSNAEIHGNVLPQAGIAKPAGYDNAMQISRAESSRCVNCAWQSMTRTTSRPDRLAEECAQPVDFLPDDRVDFGRLQQTGLDKAQRQPAQGLLRQRLRVE